MTLLRRLEFSCELGSERRARITYGDVGDSVLAVSPIIRRRVSRLAVFTVVTPPFVVVPSRSKRCVLYVVRDATRCWTELPADRTQPPER